MSNMDNTEHLQVEHKKHLAIFDNLTGQHHVINSIKTAVQAYHNDKQIGVCSSPENTIAVGPGGLGKTTICKLAHQAYGFPPEKFFETLGTTLNQETLISTLLTLDNESTLYVDEAMGLTPDLKQILLKALEEHLLLIPDQKKSKIHKIPLEKFHCCLSLTDEHTLEPALRQRFPIYLRFQLYNENEIIDILRQKAKDLNFSIYEENDIYTYLAFRSRNTPRIAIQHLKASWRVARSENSNNMTHKHAKKAMKLAQIFDGGCTIDDINYLTILNETPHQPTRLNIISSKLALPPKTITDVIESWLIQFRLIEKLPAGRMLTEKGLLYINSISEHI